MPKKKVSRQQRWQSRKQEAGLCWKCGAPTETKLNGEHFRLCAAHREADLMRKVA